MKWKSKLGQVEQWKERPHVIENVCFFPSEISLITSLIMDIITASKITYAKKITLYILVSTSV